MKLCIIDGCGRTYLAKGYCSLHYQRVKHYGDPQRGRRRKYKDVVCVIAECGRPASDADVCGMHAQRVRRYGDPDYVTPQWVMIFRNREAQAKTKKAKPSSYLKFYGRHEHRVVAEQMLARALRKGEIVHHKDGNKHNNAPENLEVMTQSEHIAEHRVAMNRARARKSRGR